MARLHLLLTSHSSSSSSSSSSAGGLVGFFAKVAKPCFWGMQEAALQPFELVPFRSTLAADEVQQQQQQQQLNKSVARSKSFAAAAIVIK